MKCRLLEWASSIVLLFTFLGLGNPAWPSWDRRSFSEGEIRGKARVWVFLSAKCPCSDSHIEKLNAAFQTYSGQGFEFVGIHSNQDESEDLAQSYFTRRGVLFPVFEDHGAKIADRFGALKTPHVFIESPHHEILYQGGIDDSKHAQTSEKNFLNDALAAVREGKPVSPSKTRTLGCVISRR